MIAPKHATKGQRKAIEQRIRDVSRGADVGRVQGIFDAFGVSETEIYKLNMDRVRLWGPGDWIDWLVENRMI